MGKDGDSPPPRVPRGPVAPRPPRDHSPAGRRVRPPTGVPPRPGPHPDHSTQSPSHTWISQRARHGSLSGPVPKPGPSGPLPPFRMTAETGFHDDYVGRTSRPAAVSPPFGPPPTRGRPGSAPWQAESPPFRSSLPGDRPSGVPSLALGRSGRLAASVRGQPEVPSPSPNRGSGCRPARGSNRPRMIRHPVRRRPRPRSRRNEANRPRAGSRSEPNPIDATPNPAREIPRLPPAHRGAPTHLGRLRDRPSKDLAPRPGMAGCPPDHRRRSPSTPIPGPPSRSRRNEANRPGSGSRSEPNSIGATLFPKREIPRRTGAHRGAPRRTGSPPPPARAGSGRAEGKAGIPSRPVPPRAARGPTAAVEVSGPLHRTARPGGPPGS
ncbi:hypothetical protein ElP_26290 [Tautonia plasticadhaerens]|uniref:Uncharacterized protein n=1 Tax=Tautonia plasticadhaerens TaxID=2527974 RepID=A0A518H1L8_9BACT|nr:hypothetical protein ElP_26290 [Tautonia plasticadhaerens]